MERKDLPCDLHLISLRNQLRATPQKVGPRTRILSNKALFSETRVNNQSE